MGPQGQAAAWADDDRLLHGRRHRLISATDRAVCEQGLVSECASRPHEGAGIAAVRPFMRDDSHAMTDWRQCVPPWLGEWGAGAPVYCSACPDWLSSAARRLK